MTTLIILDTCVFPRRGKLRGNPILSAIIEICKLQDFRIAITEVGFNELESARRRAAEDALRELSSSVAKVQRFMPEEILLYIPDVEDAVDSWTSELSSSFEIVDLHGDDAIEALRREAARMPPARPTADGSAVGSRDAAIWLTAKRSLFQMGVGRTIFVSPNTSDFASKSSDGLRPELVVELGDRATDLVYVASLSALLSMIAEIVPTATPGSELAVELADSVALLLLDPARLQGGVFAYDDPSDVACVVQEIREISSYAVSDGRLCRYSANYELQLRDDIRIDEPTADGERLVRVDAVKGVVYFWAFHAQGRLDVSLEELAPA